MNDTDAETARTIFTYATKDYENKDEADLEARTIFTYATKDYENETED